MINMTITETIAPLNGGSDLTEANANGTNSTNKQENSFLAAMFEGTFDKYDVNTDEPIVDISFNITKTPQPDIIGFHKNNGLILASKSPEAVNLDDIKLAPNTTLAILVTGNESLTDAPRGPVQTAPKLAGNAEVIPKIMMGKDSEKKIPDANTALAAAAAGNKNTNQSSLVKPIRPTPQNPVEQTGNDHRIGMQKKSNYGSTGLMQTAPKLAKNAEVIPKIMMGKDSEKKIPDANTALTAAAAGNKNTNQSSLVKPIRPTPQNPVEQAGNDHRIGMQKRPNHGSTGFLQTASESNANAATLTKQTEMPLSLVEPSSSKSPKAEYFSAAQNKENGAEQNLQQPAASAVKPKFTAEQPVFVSQLGEGGVAEKPLVETSSLTGISEAPMPVAAKTYADTSIHRPEMARHVAQQLADVAKHMPNRPIELSLNPEELGRVRMTFTINETGINIAVLTERGETMDLLRRNIETLAQEFRELGHKDVNFNFSSNSQKNDEQNSDDSDAGNSSEIEHLETDQLEPARISLGQMNGLDIRL